MSGDWETGTGPSEDAAIGDALSRLGVTRDEAEIELMGKFKKMFGLGEEVFRIRARKKSPDSVHVVEMSLPQIESKLRHAAQPAPVPPKSEPNLSAARPAGDDADHEGRSARRQTHRELRDARFKNRKSHSADTPSPEPGYGAHATGVSRGRDKHRGRGGRQFDRGGFDRENDSARFHDAGGQDRQEPSSGAIAFVTRMEEEGDDRDSRLAGVSPEAAEMAVQITKELLTKMDIGSFEVEPVTRGKTLVVRITAESEGIIIGHKGETLEALQYYVDIAVNRKQRDRARISLDAADYRLRQRARLVDIANSAVEQVKQSGRRVKLKPMSAGDRRVVHAAVAEHPGVETRSEGSGLSRSVVLYPARSEKRAASGDAAFE